MDLVNYSTGLPACYGQSPCPNAPNPCYCTGKCTINKVYGPSPQHRGFIAQPINEAHAAKIKGILSRDKPQPVFVQDHNTEEAADVLNAKFAPIQEVLVGFASILRYKNKAYGNSGLSEVGVLSKASALEKLLARADDKIARIKNSEVLRKNDICDLMGYLVLICAKQGWTNFTDQQD